PAGGRSARPDRVGGGTGGGRGLTRDRPRASRDTLASQVFRRPRLNATLKTLLFWIVLAVVAILIWNFSAYYQRNENQMAFSAFLQALDNNQVAEVTITGSEITGSLMTATDGNGTSKFKTVAPTQYEGLGNKLIDHKVKVT